jgi:hypothetical protein
VAPRIAFHIGYHKTATTWFQREALPRHPGIHPLVSAVGNDPFLTEIVLRSDRAFDAAHARAVLDRRISELGVPADGTLVVSEERLSGHAATGGFDTFRIADRLAAVVPDALVFFVVREQVAMIESEYLQLVQEGSLASLRWLLDFTPRAATVPGFDLDHYEYDRLADHYGERFGRDRVRLFEFRAVTGDPRRYLDDVATFLGVEPWPALPPEVLGRRVNPGLPKRLVGVRRFMNHFERRPLNPHPVVSMHPFWRGPLWALASRLPARRRPLLDDATRATLRARYAPSNARLAERYGITFSPDSS